MIFRIRNDKGLFSTGGETVGWKIGGKFWSSLSAFASHLASHVPFSQKNDRKPASLFKLYGNCVVVEIPENGVGHINEISFSDWYEKYYNTSEKFRAARKAEKEAAKQSILAKTPEPKSVNSKLVSEPVVVGKPRSWDVPTKTTIERAFTLASRFVPNMQLEKIKEHPKTGESFAHIVISGESYALLKL